MVLIYINSKADYQPPPPPEDEDTESEWGSSVVSDAYDIHEDMDVDAPEVVPPEVVLDEDENKVSHEATFNMDLINPDLMTMEEIDAILNSHIDIDGVECGCNACFVQRFIE